MKDNHYYRILFFLFLFFGTLSLGVGFAFFSNSLSIQSSANVMPNSSTFRVAFASSSLVDGTSIETGDIIPSRNVEGFSASPAVIDNTGEPTLKDISVSFTEPGQAASYTFYVANIGEFIAYLKSITFENVLSGNSFKVCTPGENTTPALVGDACQDIVVTIDVGSLGVQTGSVSNITNHSLPLGNTEKVILNIEYRSNGHRADGDFTVSFGDISLLYTSVDS